MWSTLTHIQHKCGVQREREMRWQTNAPPQSCRQKMLGLLCFDSSQPPRWRVCESLTNFYLAHLPTRIVSRVLTSYFWKFTLLCWCGGGCCKEIHPQLLTNVLLNPPTKSLSLSRTTTPHHTHHATRQALYLIHQHLQQQAASNQHLLFKILQLLSFLAHPLYRLAQTIWLVLCSILCDDVKNVSPVFLR